MFGGKGNHSSGAAHSGFNMANSKTPPGWGPDQESVYPFRNWLKDIITWSNATDLDPGKHAHAVVLRLTGTARVVAQEIDPGTLTTGDMIDLNDGNGPSPHTGLAVLVYRINQRFGDQEIETQLRSVIEVMSFQRMQGETLDNALTRFDVLLYRSSGQAGFDLSVAGKAFLVLYRCGVPIQGWPNLFMQARTTNNFFPMTEPELVRLKSAMRNNNHLLEHGPRNLAQLAQSTSPHAQGATYFAGSDPWSTSSTAYPTNVADYPAEPSYAGGYDASSFPASTSNQSQQCEGCDSQTAHSYYDDACVDTDTEDEAESADPSHDWNHEFAGLVRSSGLQVAGESIHSDYLIHKARWRRFTGRVPRQQRFQTRKSSKGKGKGKFGGKSSFGSPRFLCDCCSTYEDYSLVAFSKGKGKGKSSGKSFPRKNPIGADGKVMECSICNSDMHLRRFCPKANHGNTSGSSFPAAHLVASAPAQATIDRSPAGALQSMMTHMQPSHPPSWFVSALDSFNSVTDTQYSEPRTRVQYYDNMVLSPLRPASDHDGGSSWPIDPQPAKVPCGGGSTWPIDPQPARVPCGGGSTWPIGLERSVPSAYLVNRFSTVSSSNVSRFPESSVHIEEASAPVTVPPRSSSDVDALSRVLGMKYCMPWMPFECDSVCLLESITQMHERTKLSNGRVGLLVDPGAYDNLCGMYWLASLVAVCRQYSLEEKWFVLARVLGVEGVGAQPQKVTHGVHVPIALDAYGSNTEYTAPVVADSAIPGLLGLRSMEAKESVLDMRVEERKLYCGPVKITPLPGCVVHQLYPSPSGHLILPCDNFSKSKKFDGTTPAFTSTFQ